MEPKTTEPETTTTRAPETTPSPTPASKNHILLYINLPQRPTTPQNTMQKSISIVFCVSAICHDSSLSKFRKQKQSPPGRVPF
jgi:hypothetical protein